MSLRRFVVEIYELSQDGERKGHAPCGYFECDEGDLMTIEGEKEITSEMLKELYSITGAKK